MAHALAAQSVPKNSNSTKSAPVKLLAESIIRTAQAANQLVLENQGFIYWFINNKTIGKVGIINIARTFDIEKDIEQAAEIGMLEAARRFDESRGVLFVTYAAWWMKKEILEFIRNQLDGLKIPRGSISTYRCTIRALEFIDKHQGLPSESDVQELIKQSLTVANIVQHLMEKPGRVEATKKRIERITIAIKNARNLRSMQDLIDDEGSTRSDVIGHITEDDIIHYLDLKNPKLQRMASSPPKIREQVVSHSTKRKIEKEVYPSALRRYTFSGNSKVAYLAIEKLCEFNDLSVLHGINIFSMQSAIYNHPNSEVRKKLIELISFYPSKTSVSVLVSVLYDTEIEIQERAAQTLLFYAKNNPKLHEEAIHHLQDWLGQATNGISHQIRAELTNLVSSSGLVAQYV